MRSLLFATAAILLPLFTSCKTTDLTKADLAAFKLSDLTRFGQPHIVKVSREEVKKIDKAEVQSGQLASLDPKHQFQTRQDAPVDFEAPADFDPPTLPGGNILFDGSILPPKEGGTSAALSNYDGLSGPAIGVPAYPADYPQNFSIE